MPKSLSPSSAHAVPQDTSPVTPANVALGIPQDDPLIPVGHINKAHGIRGEVSLVFDAESTELLHGDVFLQPRGGGVTRTLRITRTRMHHGALLVTFTGVTTRNDAELLRGLTVSVPRSTLPPLDDDELYLSDLPGVSVVVVEENSPERVIGTITSVDIPAGQELWTITTPDGKEILFPAVDEFVLSIDLEEGTARIAPPPGLLDLYLSD